MAYREPDRSIVDEDDLELPLPGPPEGFFLHANWWTYRRRIVRFALMVLDSDGNELARLDTCHGTIHRHDQGGTTDRTYEVIPDEGQAYVDEAYTRYWDRVMTDWTGWVTG